MAAGTVVITAEEEPVRGMTRPCVIVPLRRLGDTPEVVPAPPGSASGSGTVSQLWRRRALASTVAITASPTMTATAVRSNAAPVQTSRSSDAA